MFEKIEYRQINRAQNYKWNLYGIDDRFFIKFLAIRDPHWLHFYFKETKIKLKQKEKPKQTNKKQKPKKGEETDVS